VRSAIVIPAWNESGTIASVVEAVSPFGTVLVVDDGSTDETASLARAAGAEVVVHDVNQGYEGALNSGFTQAANLGVEAVVTFDADGQHEPSVLPLFLGPIERDEADLVIGVRPDAARLGEALFNAYVNRRHGVPDILCGLKAYRLDERLAKGGFDTGRSVGTAAALSVLRHGGRVAVVPVPIHPRVDEPRFGDRWRANKKLLVALWDALRADWSGPASPRTP